MRVYDVDETIFVPCAIRDRDGDIEEVAVCTNPFLNPADVEVVLTGRKKSGDKELKKQLYGIGCINLKKVIYYPKRGKFSLKDLATWKAKVLTDLNAREYIDDDPVFTRLLEKKWSGEIKTVSQISPKGAFSTYSPPTLIDLY